MPLRRIWTEFQDKTLKYLRQDLNIQRWSLIAQKLQNDFGIIGRNQKQCRQRYHNHLDSSLKMGKLTEDEELLLFNLHNKLGNRWAQIATYFEGRTDSSLKNIFHSKLRKGIRKFNRISKEKFNKKAKIYPLNFLSKIMDKYQLKLNEQIDKKGLDLNFLNYLQNKLIQFAGSSANQTRLGKVSENQVFQHLNHMLSKIQQYQKPDGQIENESGSESSEYIPDKRIKNLENNIYSTKMEENEKLPIQVIQTKSSLNFIHEMQRVQLMNLSQYQQQIYLARKRSFQTETALSQHFEEKSQNNEYELSLNHFNQPTTPEFQDIHFDDLFYKNTLDNEQKDDETEIYYRQISQSQCSPSQQLFNLMVDYNFNEQMFF